MRLLYDKHSVSSPSVLYSPAIDRKQLSDVSDGTYYFHAQFQNANDWGAISHLRFQIDTLPPKEFAVTVVRKSSDEYPEPVLSLTATDKTSGVDHYSLAVGNGEATNIEPSETSQYTLLATELGLQRVVAKAYDRAGNAVAESIELTIASTSVPAVSSTGQTSLTESRTPLSQWGSTVLGYLLFAFAVVAGVALVIGVGYILWFRLGHLRRRLKHMTVRSGRGVQYDFERIMDDLHSLATLLHKAKQSRQLTKEEDVILETLKHHLKKMEDDILSRLEQIDDEAGE